jgi:hypothetical protein
MGLIPGKGLDPKGETLPETLQSGAGCGGIWGRFRVQNRLKTLDNQLPHGGVLLGRSDFNTLQKRIRKFDRGSHDADIYT